MRTHVFNTFFYSKLIQVDKPIGKSKPLCAHDKVRKWTKNVNIFEKDFIFVPINEE